MQAGEAGRHLRRALVVLAALTLVLGTVAGCGGDDGDEAENGTTPAGEAGGDLVEQARSEIEQAREPLEFEPPGSEIDVSEVQGKRVLVLSVDQRIPALAAVASAIREAGGVAGVQVSTFDARSDPSRMQQGVRQASQQADAMILLGIPIALVEQNLPPKEQVPAVSVLNNEPVADDPGQGAGSDRVYASTAPSYFRGGQLAAYKAIVDTDAAANVVIFNTSEITPAASVVSGMRDVLDRCDECTVRQNDTPLAEWATALTGKAQSEIRRNPDVNYLLPIFDGMAIFVTAGINQAGAADRVQNASFNATPAALKLIQNGDPLTADPGQPNGWTGWAALDQALRGMLGEEPAEPEIPQRYFDAENLEGVNVDDEAELFGDPDYEGGFRELWGVDD
ncbi:MAG: sugar ABC transporter substrate-binding protein [Thermoleophilia bacterium]|nr:sugar ABC transporter substrate-binding protein [Thermoleophilia bacterium]